MDINESLIRWKWACSQLGVSEYATKEEIKKAFRDNAKKYHPDATKNDNTEAIYINIQNAYEYLLTNERPIVSKNIIQQRPNKVLGNDAVLNRQLKKNKEIERSKQKAKNWVPKENFRQTIDREKEIKNKTQTEEEVLNQIRAILLAEHIKRQIQSDKEKKLYKAFMQHEILEQEEKGNRWE